MMANAPEPGELELLLRAAPYHQRRLSGHDQMARLVSLAGDTLAMPYGNRPNYHYAGVGKMVEASKKT